MKFRPITPPTHSFSTQGAQPDKNNLRVPSAPSQAEASKPPKATPPASGEVYSCSHPVKPESAGFDGSEIHLCIHVPDPESPEGPSAIYQCTHIVKTDKPGDFSGDVDPGFTIHPDAPSGDSDPGFSFKPGDFTGDVDPGFTIHPDAPSGDSDPGFSFKPGDFTGDVDPGFSAIKQQPSIRFHSHKPED